MSCFETPSQSCVVNVTSTRLYTFSHSGWWSIFSANNAVRLMKDHAWLKSVKMNVFVIDWFSFIGTHGKGVPWYVSNRTDAATSWSVSFCGASFVATVDERKRYDVVDFLAAALCKDDVDRVKEIRVFIMLGCIAIPEWELVWLNQSVFTNTAQARRVSMLSRRQNHNL